MQFFEWRTQYQDMKRVAKRDRLHFTYSELEFYDRCMKNFKHFDTFDRPGNAIVAALSEREWIKFGKPYYKVYPQIATMMSEVSVDIPVKELELPYPVFSVMLADDPQNDFYEPGKPKLRSLLLSRFYSEEVNKHEFKISADTGGFHQEPTAMLKTPALFVNIAFDGYYKEEPLMYDFTLALDKEDTFEERFENSWNANILPVDSEDYVPSKELWKRVLKLAVSTCFFGIDRHEVVLPDLPRRVIEAKSYRQDLGEGLRTLRDERKKVDTKKWTIGYEISLPRPIVERPDHTSSGKRELKHGYMRRGHMRWQRCGEGRQNQKLIFIHPHMVREDLPLASSHGYRIPDVSPVRT
jgi:hypothetical protein